MVEESIVNTIRRYIQLVNSRGIPVRRAVLFGSYARGQQREESDIDLLILSPVFDGIRNRQQETELWRLTWKVDSRIEPIPVGERQFEDDDVSPIIEIARREGVEVLAE